MTNYPKMLIERLRKPADGRPLRPDQLGLAYLDGAESVRGCEDMAYLLFMLIRTHHDERQARRIFAMWSKPPSPKRLRLIANMGLLCRLDMMKPKPNVQRLARELAEENRQLPRAKQRGAGGTDPIELAQQIRRQVRLRQRAIAKGQWYGPMRVDE